MGAILWVKVPNVS